MLAANFILNADISIPIDKIAYYTGYIIGMIVDLIIGAISTGGAKTVADVLKIIAKQFQELFGLIKKLGDETVTKIKNLFEEFIFIFAEVRRSAKNIKPFLKEVLEWLKKFFENVKKSKSVDELADLTKNELDWMASRSIGNLGGNILKASQIRKLRGLLKEKGITLIVDGDAKYITNLFKPIGEFKKVEDLFYFMRQNDKVGAFNPFTKQMILPKNTTEIVAFHEMAHVKHFEEVGEIAYKGYNKLEKEMYVWKQILANRSKWTEKELIGSLDYINDIRVREFGLEILKIK